MKMNGQPEKRFNVVIEEGHPHGGLYELEQTTYYHVIDTRTEEVVMTFRGEMEASLSTSTGQWDDYHFYGVSEVTITSDETAVKVQYYDGREEILALPE